ncbi:MAG: hypothetical protein M1321_00055 [Candidatus Marsarchaeota archaeon]|jgi:hypothetical protein|nr:hypothetical protein [Candidatus Marsarchaeota archaeon]
MDGNEGTVEDSIMKGFRKEVRRNLEREAKGFGMEPARYKRVWHETRDALEQILGYLPSPKVVSSAVRASIDVARAANHCMLYEREYHVDVRMEARNIISSEGTEATSMEILSKEAAWPPLQSLLRLLWRVSVLSVSASVWRGLAHDSAHAPHKPYICGKTQSLQIQ